MPMRIDPAPTTSSGTALTVKELDGTPTVTNVSTIQVMNDQLTDNGSGNVTIGRFVNKGKWMSD